MRGQLRILTTVIAMVTTVFLAWPVPAGATITPTVVQKVTASDGALYDQFGRSTAMAGNTAVVGAPADDSGKGAVYVFTLSAGTWTQRQKLTADDGAASDAFGVAVGIFGDTIIVGALNANGHRGAAYVFTGSADTWSQQAKLTADTTAYSGFGSSVAVAGDVAVIGVPNANVGDAAAQGIAYVFTRSGSDWTERSMLVDNDGAQSDHFGQAVAMAGNTILVGANSGNGGTGAAYVYTGAADSWSLQQKLTAIDAGLSDEFGREVAIYGDTAFIGADSEDGAGTDIGAAYVFTRSDGVWTQQQKLTATDGASWDKFGGSVAVYGDVGVVGAYQDEDNRGSAYVFMLSGGAWSEQAKLTATCTNAVVCLFGDAAAISNNVALISSTGDYMFKGAAHFFTLPQAAAAPVVAVDVSPDSLSFGQEATITATATGDAAIASVEYTLAKADSGWTSMAYDSDAGTWTAKVTPEGAGSYLACVKATDVNDLSSATNFADDDTDDATQTDECDDFDVMPVQLAIVYSSDTLDLNGAPTRLEATVSGGPSSCYDGEPVPFAWSDDDDGSSTNDGSDSDDANELGVATRDVSLALGHVYEVLVSIGSLDVNDDDTDDCLGSDNESNVAGVTVADPNAASTGGGWYKVDGATPPRVNFGYTAQRKYDRKLKEWFTSGNLLLINQESWRLKGKVVEGGVLPSCPSDDFARCAAFRGDGTLYEWDKVNGEWVNGRPVMFTFRANDGGTGKVCTTNAKGKTTCKDVAKPDAFGIEIDQETVDAESGPVLLMGGGLVVK